MTTPPVPAGARLVDTRPSVVTLPSLVRAELLRMRHTRLVRSSLILGAVAAVALQLVQALLSRREGDDLTTGFATTGVDLAGFAVLLVAGVACARDYGVGAIYLLRIAVPQRRRRLWALSYAYALAAAALATIVILAAICTLAACNRTALAHPAVVLELTTRSAVCAVLLACTGIGLGVLTRSSPGAVFMVLTLYWLLPIGLLLAGFSGSVGAANLAELTLSMLAARAIGPEVNPGWQAVVGIAIWAAALTALGFLREMKGR